MISHFNLSGSENFFYLDISAIQQHSFGLKITGVVGDGSAEALFEACIGAELQVCVFPIWEDGQDSLCQRYDQSLIEQGLVSCLEDVRFCSEKTFDPDTGSWQQSIIALAKKTNPSLWPVARIEMPHQHVCEMNAIWQRQAAC